jgi:hypothetical protein
MGRSFESVRARAQEVRCEYLTDSAKIRPKALQFPLQGFD